MTERRNTSGAHFQHHPRDWRDNLYVYPVISRRSHGLSIGINLNPDAACNFDCIYCQVDRETPPKIRRVEIDRLRTELAHMLQLADTGCLFDDPRFGSVPTELRRVNDIAFSGDGEPTTCPVFVEAVRAVADLKRAARMDAVKILLITDACYLTRSEVVRGLEIMDANCGEVWAKLDAGTQDYFAAVNRPSHTLADVMRNIIATAQQRSIRIQSLFMSVRGAEPPREEIEAYCQRLTEIVSAGGSIAEVQVYTVARQTAETYVAALPDESLDDIARRVRQVTSLDVATYPSGFSG